MCCSRFPVGEGHKPAVRPARVFLKFRNEFRGSRNLTILPTLGVEAELRFGCYAHCAEFKVDVTPEQIHDLLFAKTRQQEGREQRMLENRSRRRRIVPGPARDIPWG